MFNGIKESFITVDGGEMFIRHSEPVAGSQGVVWIHGIGESSLCFAEAFSRPELRGLTLIAPDMLGFGRSSRADDGDYSFAAQVRRLWMVCDHFGINAPYYLTTPSTQTRKSYVRSVFSRRLWRVLGRKNW